MATVLSLSLVRTLSKAEGSILLCGRLCAWEGVCDANLLSRVVITIRRLIMWKFDVFLEYQSSLPCYKLYHKGGVFPTEVS